MRNIPLLNAFVVHERMAEAFAQLHEDVAQARTLTLFQTCLRAEDSLHQVRILSQYGTIEFLLHNRHADWYNDLRHGRQERQHLRLRSPQEEWSNHIMQLTDLVRVQFRVLLLQLCSIIRIVQEVQEIEELTLVVLKWRAREQNSERRLQPPQSRVQQVFVVLQPLSFINDQALPWYTPEETLAVVVRCSVVARNDNVATKIFATLRKKLVAVR